MSSPGFDILLQYYVRWKQRETVMCTYIVLGFFLTELIFCFIQEKKKEEKTRKAGQEERK